MDIKTELEVQTKLPKLRMEQDRQYTYNLTLRRICETNAAVEKQLSITYRVSQEECEILRESVPYVKLYRYNPKHLYPKLNGYGDNGQRSLKL